MLANLFADAGADGFLHVVDLDSGAEVGHHEDELVVSASVFKIPVMLKVAAQAAEERFALTDRIRVPAGERVLGPTGTSVMLDDVDLSIRDLASLMMSVSDNTATDVLLDLVGLDAVHQRLAALGLQHILVGGCRELLGALGAEVDLQPGQARASVDPDRLAAAPIMQPAETTRTTARETTTLLRLIWTEQAAAPEACTEVRRIMALQVWPRRLRSGFPGAVLIGAETGTLVFCRNEAGVTVHPDGRRVAVAVFTRAATVEPHQPTIDRAMGAAARAAVDQLP